MVSVTWHHGSAAPLASLGMTGTEKECGRLQQALCSLLGSGTRRLYVPYFVVLRPGWLLSGLWRPQAQTGTKDQRAPWITACWEAGPVAAVCKLGCGERRLVACPSHSGHGGAQPRPLSSLRKARMRLDFSFPSWISSRENDPGSPEFRKMPGGPSAWTDGFQSGERQLWLSWVWAGRGWGVSV